MRGALYIDGFNLYHALDDLGKPYLKWLDLMKLGNLVARGHAKEIVRAVFCTAYFPGDYEKRKRHEDYVAALKLVGVETVLGHTVKEPLQCKGRDCGFRWDQPREKETDINLALSIYEDALADVYDVAFFISADTDQVVTYKAIRANCPDKKITTVFPPGRPQSKHLRDLSDLTIGLKETHIDQCVLPAMVMREGFRTVPRPLSYAPPEGWVHPDDRPK